MQEKRNVKPKNVTIKHGTNSLEMIADIETPDNFRQNDYGIHKSNNK